MIRRARLKIAEPRLSGAPLCEQHQGQIWGRRLWNFLGEFQVASSLLNLEQTPVWFSKLWSFLKFFATLPRCRLCHGKTADALEPVCAGFAFMVIF